MYPMPICREKRFRFMGLKTSGPHLPHDGLLRSCQAQRGANGLIGFRQIGLVALHVG